MFFCSLSSQGIGGDDDALWCGHDAHSSDNLFGTSAPVHTLKVLFFSFTRRRVNADEFNRRFRHVACAALVREKVDEAAGHLLLVSEHHVQRQSHALRFLFLFLWYMMRVLFCFVFFNHPPPPTPNPLSSLPPPPEYSADNTRTYSYE